MHYLYFINNTQAGWNWNINVFGVSNRCFRPYRAFKEPGGVPVALTQAAQCEVNIPGSGTGLTSVYVTAIHQLHCTRPWTFLCPHLENGTNTSPFVRGPL